MSDTPVAPPPPVDFEALGRYHDAMKRARIVLTERDRWVGEARERLSQLLLPTHSEFVLFGKAMTDIEDAFQKAWNADNSLDALLSTAIRCAVACREVAPSFEYIRNGVASIAIRDAESITLTPTATTAHDPARVLDAGN